MSGLLYKKVKLVVGDNEIKVFNMENGKFITTLNVKNEVMQECIFSITELLSAMDVKFRLNDDFFYKKYGRRLIPAIRI